MRKPYPKFTDVPLHVDLQMATISLCTKFLGHILMQLGIGRVGDPFLPVLRDTGHLVIFISSTAAILDTLLITGPACRRKKDEQAFDISQVVIKFSLAFIGFCLSTLPTKNMFYGGLGTAAGLYLGQGLLNIYLQNYTEQPQPSPELGIAQIIEHKKENRFEKLYRAFRDPLALCIISKGLVEGVVWAALLIYPLENYGAIIHFDSDEPTKLDVTASMILAVLTSGSYVAGRLVNTGIIKMIRCWDERKDGLPFNNIEAGQSEPRTSCCFRRGT